MEGLLYEPRSLWSIANARVRSDVVTPTTVRLNRRHFTNLTRWPMTFKRLAVTGVGYTFNQALDPFTSGVPSLYKQSTDIAQQVGIEISAPQRYHLNSKLSISSATLAPRPTWEPPSGYPGIVSAWNTSRLQCDTPLYIPKTGALEWQLSGYNTMTSVDVQAPSANGVFVTMLYQERGGMFFGNCRQHQYFARPFSLPGGAALSPFYNSEEKWPFPPDLFSTAATYGGVVTNDWWDPKANFSAGKFKRQNATRDGSTAITDLRASISQAFGWDVLVQAAMAASYPGAYVVPPVPPGAKLPNIAPLSTHMGTRIKTVGCGSEAWWWRPGAPLALVFDAQTPALVYDLHREFTLEPGDSLDVTMTLPAMGADFGDTSPFDVPFHVGISLNGYSPIEG